MAEASPVEAALFAFRKREKRFVLTSASVAYTIASLALGALMLAAIWPSVAAAMTWYVETWRTIMSGGEPSEPPVQMMRGVLPWYGLFGLLGLILLAAFEAACLRWMIRGERGGLMGLTLGADTWRVFLTYFVWLVLGVLFAMLVVVSYGLLFLLSNALPVVRPLFMLIALLMPLALAALGIWGATRLSPAAAMSIARRKFSFFHAWGATRERFWDLLGAFVILLAAYLAIGTLMSVLIRIPMTYAMIPIFTDVMSRADVETIIAHANEALSNPLLLAIVGAYMIASMVLGLLLYVAWFGVNAYAASGGAAATPAAAPSA
jgi:hypothetical protein